MTITAALARRPNLNTEFFFHRSRPATKRLGEAMKHSLPAIVSVLLVVGLAQPLAAKVVKFEILRTESPAFEGRTFGAVGTYDRIIARATIAVSPSDSHNSIIVDIDRAPPNSQGLVEALSDVEILRPTIAANGNHHLWYEVVNRGTKLAPALSMTPVLSTSWSRLRTQATVF